MCINRSVITTNCRLCECTLHVKSYTFGSNSLNGGVRSDNLSKLKMLSICSFETVQKKTNINKYIYIYVYRKSGPTDSFLQRSKGQIVCPQHKSKIASSCAYFRPLEVRAANSTLDVMYMYIRITIWYTLNT